MLKRESKRVVCSAFLQPSLELAWRSAGKFTNTFTALLLSLRGKLQLGWLVSGRAALLSSKCKSFLENTCPEMGWQQQPHSCLIQRLCLLDCSVHIPEQGMAFKISTHFPEKTRICTFPWSCNGYLLTKNSPLISLVQPSNCLKCSFHY